jgi:hypothetical protein
VALAMVCLGLVMAPAAEARDMNGRLGIGAQRTLGGVRGFDLMYWAGKIALNGTINLFYHSPSEGDGGLDIGLAVGALFPIVTSDTFDLGFGGRLDLTTRDGAGTQISLEGPLRLTWYATDHLQLFGEVGVVVEIVPEEGRNVTPVGTPTLNGKGTGIYFGSTGVTGGAGFNFIF